MRKSRLGLLPLVAFLALAGCGKASQPSAGEQIEKREKAIQGAVEGFRQRLAALEPEYPALLGVAEFPCTDLGFEFGNNSVNSRVYVSVAVQDASNGPLRTVPTNPEKLAGTPFVTALHIECADAALREEIERAYGQLREDLVEVNLSLIHI